MSTVAVYDATHNRLGEIERGSSAHFRVEFIVAGDPPNWLTNGVVFPTREDANIEGRSRASAWTMVMDWRVVTDDTPLKQPLSETGPGEWG